MQEYFTTKQAAEILKVTQRTIYRYMKSGKLEYSKTASGTIRISAPALLSFVGEPGKAHLLSGEMAQGYAASVK